MPITLQKDQNNEFISNFLYKKMCAVYLYIQLYILNTISIYKTVISV